MTFPSNLLYGIKKGGKYVESVFTAFFIFAKENDNDEADTHATEQPDVPSYKDQDLVNNRYKLKKMLGRLHRERKIALDIALQFQKEKSRNDTEPFLKIMSELTSEINEALNK